MEIGFSLMGKWATKVKYFTITQTKIHRMAGEAFHHIPGKLF
jgi:hypothetical protein